jgi:hypothetical protein
MTRDSEDAEDDENRMTMEHCENNRKQHTWSRFDPQNATLRAAEIGGKYYIIHGS